jgi:para-aminobenzoate synthetase component 1
VQVSLPYSTDGAALRARLGALGPVTLLDSGGGNRGQDIAAVLPAEELVLAADASDFAIADFCEELLALERRLDGHDAQSTGFDGGLLGFLSYELGRRLQGFPSAGGTQPLAVVRHFPWAVRQDRRSGRAWLVGERQTAPDIEELRALLRRPAAEPPGAPRLRSPFAGCWDFPAYRERFDAAMRYIHAGDCYQVNLGQPYRAPYEGDLAAGLAPLQRLARAPYGACFPLCGNASLLCLSPEQFLSVENGLIQTRPIKGTRPRHGDPVQDQRLAMELERSEKERAENLMIVDLLRNDIGRFSLPGSVRAEELFTVESFATVHHLVSRVSGRLRPGTSALSLLLGCLPGGSITGAPKRRAMEVIDELESAPRESWCGSLFSLSRGGRLESNILIRTLHGDGETLTCWAGGGLVADSIAEAEFEELEHKVGAFLRLLQH